MRWILLTTIAVALVPLQALGQQGPEDFLHEIIKADLLGDPSPRIGHVRFSNPARQAKYDKAHIAADIVPEAYDLTIDPLVIVTDSKLVSMRDEKRCVSVEFGVFARTRGQGLPSWQGKRGREINIESRQHSELIRYCAVQANGQWMLLDPPIPRVRKDVVVAAVEASLADQEKIIAKLKTNDPRAIKNVTVVRESLQRQLDTLLGR